MWRRAVGRYLHLVLSAGEGSRLLSIARPHLFFNTTVIKVRRCNTRGEGRNMTVKQGSVAADGVKGNCCFCCDEQCAA